MEVWASTLATDVDELPLALPFVVELPESVMIHVEVESTGMRESLLKLLELANIEDVVRLEPNAFSEKIEAEVEE